MRRRAASDSAQVGRRVGSDPVLQRLDRSLHRRKRGSEVVADRCEKSASFLFGGLELDNHFVERPGGITQFIPPIDSCPGTQVTARHPASRGRHGSEIGRQGPSNSGGHHATKADPENQGHQHQGQVMTFYEHRLCCDCDGGSSDGHRGEGDHAEAGPKRGESSRQLESNRGCGEGGDRHCAEDRVQQPPIGGSDVHGQLGNEQPGDQHNAQSPCDRPHGSNR
jgi:hypothetical protein